MKAKGRAYVGRHRSRRGADARRKVLTLTASATVVALLIVVAWLSATGGGESGTASGKYWVVSPPDGNGRQEFLFDIAERTLGSGGRYIEIFEMNEDRLQPNGGRLTSPDQIAPGWVLLLPTDANGPGVRDGAPPSLPSPTTEEPGGRGALTALSIVIALAVFGVLAIALKFLRLSRRHDGALAPADAAPMRIRLPRLDPATVRATIRRLPPARLPLPMSPHDQSGRNDHDILHEGDVRDGQVTGVALAAVVVVSVGVVPAGAIGHVPPQTTGPVPPDTADGAVTAEIIVDEIPAMDEIPTVDQIPTAEIVVDEIVVDEIPTGKIIEGQTTADDGSPSSRSRNERAAEPSPERREWPNTRPVLLVPAWHPTRSGPDTESATAAATAAAGPAGGRTGSS